jgi:hypothetical protein
MYMENEQVQQPLESARTVVREFRPIKGSLPIIVAETPQLPSVSELA